MLDIVAILFICLMTCGIGYLAGFYIGLDTGKREEREEHDRYGRDDQGDH